MAPEVRGSAKGTEGRTVRACLGYCAIQHRKTQQLLQRLSGRTGEDGGPGGDWGQEKQGCRLLRLGEKV